jgi:general stress protein 26
MLDETAKKLAQGPNFVALTTLLPGGHPSTQVMYMDADDDHVVVNTETGRRKYANVQRDPSVILQITPIRVHNNA